MAKNILQDVVAEVNRSTSAYLFTHVHLAELAGQARESIEHRSYKRLARIVAESWKANTLIHPSSTNEEVDELLAATSRYTAGVKLLGAGGGGYALFASPTAEKAEELRELLRIRFENERARIVDFTLNDTGLKTSVS